MADLGLRYVRIGEFAWSRIEPREGDFAFEWLDEAIKTLAGAGLEVVLGTPTATPPKWLIDKHPDILPVDPETGQLRGFGSRRHYDFSSDTYHREALRISETLARRYGEHDGVAGWQTDNELCCHDTALSASPAARDAFRGWCRQRYADIDALNSAWGNVFWSMEYQDFDQIELPVGAVTETSPAHRLAYRRFSSDRVCLFHDRMVDVLRKHSPGRFVTHNFIPMSETGVDNHALAASLDFASYDSYPLGRTDLHFKDLPAGEFRQIMRTGHPDSTSYLLEQTRGLSKRPFWIMEQQPGPVNWADSNPRPAPGMVRLWTIEAFAHGADCVSYFRWRQVPFAQEQMHSGLLRPDDSRSGSWAEIERAIGDCNRLKIDAETKRPARIAIVTDTQSSWVSDIERQSRYLDFDDVQFGYYSALRSLGVDVDFVSVSADLDDYALVIVPGMPIASSAFVDKLAAIRAAVVIGPRSGAKTNEFSIPETLPPGPLQAIVPLRVLSVETLRPDCSEILSWRGADYESRLWREEIDPGDAEVLASFGDGGAAVVRFDRFVYFASVTCSAFLTDFFRELCRSLEIEVLELGPRVRAARRGALRFAFNYADETKTIKIPEGADILLGDRTIGPHDVTVWRADDSRNQRNTAK